MKKVAIIATILTAVHLVEDFIWVVLGRYTDVPIWIVIVAIIGMGIGGGLLVKHPRIRSFLVK